MRSIAVILLAVFAVLLVGCGEKKMDIDKLKMELMQTDRDFSTMSVEKGRHTAFDFYMDDKAVIYRPEAKVFEGREAVIALFPADAKGALEWKPTFAEAAASGDLGYTLGKYTFTYTDKDGVEQMSYGHYVTIWKRQPDGSWKYVFDTGN